MTIHDRPEVTLPGGAQPIIDQHNLSNLQTSFIERERFSNPAMAGSLSPDLVEAVAWKESHFRRSVISRVGAVGEMQLMPKTARELGVNPYDPRENIRGGTTYLSGLLKRYDGDLMRALAAYNAGPKAVDHYGGIPPYPETQRYVEAILTRLSQRAAMLKEGERHEDQ